MDYPRRNPTGDPEEERDQAGSLLENKLGDLTQQISHRGNKEHRMVVTMGSGLSKSNPEVETYMERYDQTQSGIGSDPGLCHRHHDHYHLRDYGSLLLLHPVQVQEPQS